jgi:gluconokinase
MQQPALIRANAHRLTRHHVPLFIASDYMYRWIFPDIPDVQNKKNGRIQNHDAECKEKTSTGDVLCVGKSAVKENKIAVVVMGVAGSGKSSIATALATRLDGYLIEGDAFHPEENVAKMKNGVPLDDADRAGWLDRLAEELQCAYSEHKRAVLACSALKYRYRQRLCQAVPALGFVFLDLPRNIAEQRVRERSDHFMPSALMESHYAALEPPNGEPLTLTVDATQSVAYIVHAAAKWYEALDRDPG